VGRPHKGKGGAVMLNNCPGPVCSVPAMDETLARKSGIVAQSVSRDKVTVAKPALIPALAVTRRRILNRWSVNCVLNRMISNVLMLDA